MAELVQQVSTVFLCLYSAACCSTGQLVQLLWSQGAAVIVAFAIPAGVLVYRAGCLGFPCCSVIIVLYFHFVSALI